MIEQFAAQHPVQLLCRMFQVPRSGYYQWRKAVPGRRQKANAQLLARIQDAFKKQFFHL